MAKIIYKKGLEGHNRLEYIEGIEIDMMNGQSALIYPKYANLPLLNFDKIDDWETKALTQTEALKVGDSTREMDELLALDSSAAEFVRQFKSDLYGRFNMPTLLAALEIIYHRDDINALANIIEGADFLEENVDVTSCSYYNQVGMWVASGCGGFASADSLNNSHLCVPTIVYKKQQTVYMVTSERGTQEDAHNLVDEIKIFENLDNAKTYAKRKFEDVLKMFDVTKDDVRVEEADKENFEEVYSIHANFLHRYTEWDVWVLIQKKEIE